MIEGKVVDVKKVDEELAKFNLPPVNPDYILDEAELDEMEEAVAKNGVIFTVHQQRRFDPDFNVIWSSGDEVSIFAGSTLNQRYAATSYGSTTTSLEPAGSAGTGFFAGTEIPANVAVYPYGSGVTIKKSGTDGYVVSGLSIPAVQEYQAGTYANGAAPMVAVTSGAQDMLLKFRNSFGALNLRLRGDVSIKQIKVTGEEQARLFLDDLLKGDRGVIRFELREPSLHEIFVQMAGAAQEDASEGGSNE